MSSVTRLQASKGTPSKSSTLSKAIEEAELVTSKTNASSSLLATHPVPVKPKDQPKAKKPRIENQNEDPEDSSSSSDSDSDTGMGGATFYDSNEFKLLSVTERASMRQIRAFLETKIVPLIRNVEKSGGDVIRAAYCTLSENIAFSFYKNLNNF